jgi:hypothetical protein
MIHSNLRVEVQGSCILVALCEEPVSGRSIGSRTLRGSQWTSGADDSEATITIGGFRALAWEAANQKARDLGWVKSSDELHEAVKRAGGAS